MLTDDRIAHGPLGTRPRVNLWRNPYDHPVKPGEHTKWAEGPIVLVKCPGHIPGSKPYITMARPYASKSNSSREWEFGWSSVDSDGDDINYPILGWMPLPDLETGEIK